MARSLEIRLIDSPLPAGQIELTSLARIGAQLQDLSTRVSRWVAEIEGPGRGPRPVEETADLRLVGVHVGSTVLAIAAGPVDTLDFDTEFERSVDERLWAVLHGIERDAPPVDVPDGVRTSALGLLDALREAAPTVEITGSADRGGVRFAPAQRSRAIWIVPSPVRDVEPVVAAGRLEMVDVRTRRLRIVDDVGHRIGLDDVVDPAGLGVLVGRRTVVRGLPTRDRRGRVTAITSPTVEAQDVPADWTMGGGETSPWSLPEDDPGPDAQTAVDLDDDELDTFLASVRSL